MYYITTDITTASNLSDYLSYICGILILGFRTSKIVIFKENKNIEKYKNLFQKIKFINEEDYNKIFMNNVIYEKIDINDNLLLLNLFDTNKNIIVQNTDFNDFPFIKYKSFLQTKIVLNPEDYEIEFKNSKSKLLGISIKDPMTLKKELKQDYITEIMKEYNILIIGDIYYKNDINNIIYIQKTDSNELQILNLLLICDEYFVFSSSNNDLSLWACFLSDKIKSIKYYE